MCPKVGGPDTMAAHKGKKWAGRGPPGPIASAAYGSGDYSLFCAMRGSHCSSIFISEYQLAPDWSAQVFAVLS